MNRLSNHSLEKSSVVANCAMNRERGCTGDNSYAKELGLSPVEFLRERLQSGAQVAWLDLCCGTGRALIEAAQMLLPLAAGAELRLVGVDLTAMFDPRPLGLSCLQLHTASVSQWEPPCTFDLVTCVHGLHYVGDKLRLIERAVSWLKADGVFLSHLDPANLKISGDESAGRTIVRDLQRQGVDYLRGRHLLSCRGHREIRLDYQYEGADDQAGPNYTKQPAVDSNYLPVSKAKTPNAESSKGEL